jgi:LmbE family N-acetylglucosaminyl deacetylase
MTTPELNPALDPSGNQNNPGTASPEMPRRDFLKTSAFAAAAAAAALLPRSSSAAQAMPDANAKGSPHQKTILAVCGHMDDAEIGLGGILLQGVRAGHRVVLVTVCGDLSTYAVTAGREERTIREAQEMARSFGYEKRFLNGKFHQTSGADLNLKRQLAEIFVELKPEVAFIQHHEDHWIDHRESGLAAKDAILFSPGFCDDKRDYRAKVSLYGFDVTPHETYHFEPDVYCDVTDVMPAYMDLITRIRSIYGGQPLSEGLREEFRSKGKGGQVIPLDGHARLRFADTVRFGDRAGCSHAIGLTTVWGQRRGEKIV